MATLLDDLEMILPNAGTRSYPDSIEDAYRRLRAFIEVHQPWCPPRQPGFGPWIEYDGKNGPRVDEEVMILTTEVRRKRQELLFPTTVALASRFDWSLHPMVPSHIVAYCVKEDQP